MSHVFFISKDFHFSASHQLSHLPASHPCARLHGHNYCLRIELGAPSLNAHSFVRDYNELYPVKKYVDEILDHRHLNDVFGHSHITAEFLAKTIFDHFKPDFPELISVASSETLKTWAKDQPLCTL